MGLVEDPEPLVVWTGLAHGRLAIEAARLSGSRFAEQRTLSTADSDDNLLAGLQTSAGGVATALWMSFAPGGRAGGELERTRLVSSMAPRGDAFAAPADRGEQRAGAVQRIACSRSAERPRSRRLGRVAVARITSAVVLLSAPLIALTARPWLFCARVDGRVVNDCCGSRVRAPGLDFDISGAAAGVWPARVAGVAPPAPNESARCSPLTCARPGRMHAIGLVKRKGGTMKLHHQLALGAAVLWLLWAATPGSTYARGTRAVAPRRAMVAT